MESLRDAAQTIKVDNDRQQGQDEERKNIKEQQACEKRELDMRESRERVAEFIGLMHERNVPLTEYDPHTTTPFLGWIAVKFFKEYYPQGEYTSRPGVVVSQDGQTYQYSVYLREQIGISPQPDPTLLAGGEAFQRMASYLAEIGAV